MGSEVFMKKIVLIGPVYPYKGGISHYTSLLYRELAKKYEPVMVSYKMQYPKLLFKKEQRDYRNDMFKVEPTYFWLHTANPFNIVKTAWKIRNMKADLVILEWWHPYFAPCYWILSLFMGNVKKMFICHNVFPHERFPLDRFLTKMTLKWGDYFLVQSERDRKDLQSIRPDAAFRKVKHPTYNVFKSGKMKKETAREKLGLTQNEQVILFFGFVREYKGLKHLIRAMQKIHEELPQAKLLIAVDFGETKQEYLDQICQCQIENCVQIHDEYIADHEVENFFLASNVVVLPYETATQSGIAQIAYGFERPVITTNVGGLPEVVDDQNTGYLVEPGDSEGLAEKIIHYFKENKEDEFSANITKQKEKYLWDCLVDAMEDLGGWK